MIPEKQSRRQDTKNQYVTFSHEDDMVNVNSKNRATLDMFSAEATLKSNDSNESPHRSSIISKALTYS